MVRNIICTTRSGVFFTHSQQTDIKFAGSIHDNVLCLLYGLQTWSSASWHCIHSCNTSVRATVVSACKTTQCRNHEDHSLNFHCHESSVFQFLTSRSKYKLEIRAVWDFSPHGQLQELLWVIHSGYLQHSTLKTEGNKKRNREGLVKYM